MTDAVQFLKFVCLVIAIGLGIFIVRLATTPHPAAREPRNTSALDAAVTACAVMLSDMPRAHVLCVLDAQARHERTEEK